MQEDKHLMIFISQPMRDKTPKEIWTEREEITNMLSDIYKDFEIVDSFNEDFKDLNPVQALGKSLELLSQADLAIFAKGWKDARGCYIEHIVCEKYNIKTLEVE